MIVALSSSTKSLSLLRLRKLQERGLHNVYSKWYTD
jgi:hypothetical protein